MAGFEGLVQLFNCVLTGLYIACCIDGIAISNVLIYMCTHNCCSFISTIEDILQQWKLATSNVDHVSYLFIVTYSILCILL